MNQDFYSIKELSVKLGLHYNTVRKGVKDGKIMSIRIGEKRGRYRIPHAELHRLLFGDFMDVIHENMIKIRRE